MVQKQDRIKLFSLRKLISESNEKEDIQRLKELLSSFSCEKDKDIESFLHNRAIDFEFLNKSRTYLLCDNDILLNEGRFLILGYFTVALKVLDLPKRLSNNARKALDGLSAKLHGEVISSVPCYLIGQLAKNSAVPPNKSVCGSEIINRAISIIKSSVENVGGRYVMIECHNNAKLRKFYSDNAFTEFEALPYGSTQMVQMLRTLCISVPK